MRKGWISSWAVLLLAGTAAAQEAPRALLERAVQAYGGMARLSRARADKVELRGTITLGAAEVPFVGETLVQLPGHFRSVTRLTAGGAAHTVVHVRTPEGVRVTLDSQDQPVEPALAQQLDRSLQLERALRLAPLLSDPAVVLAPLGEARVGGNPALGVKVTVGGRELSLYFDKATALLVKSEHAAPGAEGKAVLHETYYGQFRDVGGRRRPCKVSAFRDGKKVMDAEVVAVQAFDAIDPAEFTRP